MDINNLRAFIEVADKRSFSRSAESLHLTQPAVSKRIAALESELSARLFDRVGRSVHLTEAGHVLLPSARQISAELDRIEEVICNLGKSVTGKLSIGTSPHIGVTYLAPVLKKFRVEYPDVDMDIEFNNSVQTIKDIEDGLFEMGLCAMTTAVGPKLREIDIWEDTLCIVVAHDHPLAEEPMVDAELLMKCPAVLPPHPSASRALIDHTLATLGHTANVNLDVADFDTLKMMVKIGLGWGLLPEALCDDETLHIIHIDGINLQRRISLIRHQDRTLSRAAQAFIKALPTKVI
ncbi:MAG: LysR family transcriptional regulator [Pseudomonadota bacterium]